MKISLVLTCIDRQWAVDRLAKSISHQSYTGEIEVIFVAQGSAEFRLPDTSAKSIRVERRVSAGLTPLSQARNIGLEGISGDIVAFPDDDCWYPPELLEKVTSLFEQDPALDCICTNIYDPDRHLSYGKRPVGVTRTVSFRNLLILPSSAGVFLRADALTRAGNFFDETLGTGTPIGSGEETELLARILAVSGRIEYRGSLQVYHPVSEYASPDIKKSYRYGLGFGHLNGRLLRQSHLAVLPWFVETLLRSFVGALLNLSNPVLRAVYWSRLAGIASGFAHALSQPSPHRPEASSL